MTVKIVQGDALDILKQIKPACLDACITDPPYHLIANKKGGSGGNGGFMGQQWDGGDVAFRTETWREVFRVLKPGAHLLAFGGTRTYHRMACAIEDAGFEIRDCIMWVYGSGFPKSHNISKAIDKMRGAERPVIGVVNNTYDGANRDPSKHGNPADQSNIGEWGLTKTPHGMPMTAPGSAEAAQWEGWGTALKPACEPIVLARKPLSEPTVAANVLKWGTGALNIDTCRIGTEKRKYTGGFGRFNETAKAYGFRPYVNGTPSHINQTFSATGRWPANVIHDGSEEVLAAFPDAPGQQRYVGPEHGDKPSRGIYGDFGPRSANEPRNNNGSAARFFYCAKASTKERRGFAHPTVKPLALMQYLIRLVTLPNGVVLDPFAGTGTTGEAASFENRHAILIELNQSYVEMAQRRCGLIQSQPHLQAAAE